MNEQLLKLICNGLILVVSIFCLFSLPFAVSLSTSMSLSLVFRYSLITSYSIKAVLTSLRVN